jgi:hypothetical protein
MQNLFSILLSACLSFATGCISAVSTSTPSASFLNAFPERPDWPDTVHCFLPEMPIGNVLADSLLKTVLDSAQFESLHYGTGDAHFRAVGQFRFGKGLRAALVYTEEFWFGKQTLLIFDPQQQKCLTAMEVSHFYGGDGGQTASESWIFRGKTPAQIYVKTAEHGITVADSPTDDPKEYLRESGRLWQWKGHQFQPLIHPDSMVFMRHYLLHKTW